MSWRLLSWLWETAPPVSAAIAAEMSGEWSATVTLVETFPAVISADVAADFGAALAIDVVAPPTVDAAIAADFAQDFSASVTMTAGVVFVPPEPGLNRIAVVTHSN